METKDISAIILEGIDRRRNGDRRAPAPVSMWPMALFGGACFAVGVLVTLIVVGG